MNRTRFASALAMAALAAILLPSLLHAQITFERTYGGGDYDEGASVQQTADGGYIVAGETFSYAALGCDVWLVKTDAHGNKVWANSFDRDTIDGAYSVQQTSEGGYIVAGWTGDSYGGGGGDIWLIKTDAYGEMVWDRTFGTENGLEYGYSVQQTSDGGYILTGETNSYGAGSWDAYLIKTDANGHTQWSRTYGGSGSDNGCSVQQTADGGYIIAGFTNSFGAGYRDVYLVKTDASGETLWTRTYGDTNAEYGYSVRQTTNGGYVVAGSKSSGSDSQYVYLVRTDATGDTLWTRKYGGLDDVGNSVRQASDGGFVVAGWAYLYGLLTDFYLVRTTPTGDTMWTRTYGGASYEEGWSVGQTSDGGFVIAGSTMSFGAGAWDVYLVKTDSFGRSAVAEPRTNPTRASCLSLSCEPNPFRTKTTISLQLAADSPTELAMFDASGRCVRTFAVNRKQCASWDGTDQLGQLLPSGTYFVQVNSGNERATSRVVLQR